MLFLLWIDSAGESSRLRRILRLYEGQHYRCDSRSLYLHGGYIKDMKDPDFDSSSGWADTLLHFSRTYGATLGYTKNLRSGSETEDFHRRLDAQLFATSRNDGFSLSGTQFNRLDTIGENVLLLGNYRQNKTYYNTPVNRVLPSFSFQLNGRAALSAKYHKEENTQHYAFEPMPDKYITKSLSADALIEVQPAIALGRSINITPVYLALDLERELKKCGAINFSLSDSTIASIAKLLAHNSSYTLRELAMFKKFKAELDSIIGEDMAAAHQNFHFLGLFAIKRIVFRRIPPSFARPRWRIFLDEQLLIQGKRTELSYPNRKGENKIINKSNFPHNLELGTDLNWGIPLSESFFTETTVQKILVTGDDGVVFYDGEPNWSKLIRYDFSLSLSWWPVLWFRSTLGIDQLPLEGVIPTDAPRKAFLDASVFIEDNIALQFEFSHSRIDESSLSYPLENHVFPHTGFGISLSAFYVF